MIEVQAPDAATEAHRRLDLDWLIAPTGAEQFWSSVWEREPLVIHRGSRAYYDPLLSLADVDHILATSAIREGDVRVIKDGQPTPVRKLGQAVLPGASNRLEGLYREYRAGATIVIQALHERWGPLGQLCRHIGRAISGAAQVNVYLTPPGETGLLPHYDTHDVMVLQASGSKHWRIFGRPIEAPSRDQPYERSSDAGAVTREFVMESGDFMYLPRGFMHVAEARDKASLHLTVGIHPIAIGAVIRRIVERSIASDARLRKALVPGFAYRSSSREESVRQVASLLDEIARTADIPGALDEAARWALVSESPSLDGHLLDLDDLDRLSIETELRVRPDLSWQLSTSDGTLSVTYNGKTVTIPDFVEPCLRHMTSSDVFAVADLPDVIDDAGKLVLTRRLLEEGFLTIKRPRDVSAFRTGV